MDSKEHYPTKCAVSKNYPQGKVAVTERIENIQIFREGMSGGHIADIKQKNRLNGGFFVLAFKHNCLVSRTLLVELNGIEPMTS